MIGHQHPSKCLRQSKPVYASKMMYRLTGEAEICEEWGAISGGDRDMVGTTDFRTPACAKSIVGHADSWVFDWIGGLAG